MQRQSPDMTIQDICRRRPALSSVLQAFSPILTCQEELSKYCAEELAKSGRTLPIPDAFRLRQGSPLLVDNKIPDCADLFAHCASSFVEPLSAIPALAGSMPSAAKFCTNLSQDEQMSLVSAVATNNVDLLENIDKLDGLIAEGTCDAQGFMFFVTFVVSSVLRGLSLVSFQNQDPTPWEENNVWQQGYCPVCGSYPQLAWLDRGKVDERNTYLLPGGARKHLHCGVCGTDWRFLRLACPVCGIAESKQIEMLSEEKDLHGEGIDWCTKCNAYLPTIDIRDRIAMPNLEAQALGMLHLELIAQEKHLHPIRSSFWNTFA